jgi:hypothetical protein
LPSPFTEHRPPGQGAVEVTGRSCHLGVDEEGKRDEEINGFKVLARTLLVKEVQLLCPPNNLSSARMSCDPELTCN